MLAEELISFEREVAEAFERGEIRGPVHLSGGNEEEVISIFSDIRPKDWVFSTWRSHYHALLKGVPRDEVMRQIKAGRSMYICSPEHNFYAAAILGGCLSISCGVAEAGSRVWCFVGDMSATTGHFADAVRFARSRSIDLHIVVEDNGLSTNTPTTTAWGDGQREPNVYRYRYDRIYPHYQSLHGGGRGF